MSSTTTPTFGASLRAIRKSVLLSQSRFAEYLGVDHSYVSRLESGARMPSRQFVEGVIRDCGLHGPDADQLLLSAGFAPSTAHVIDGEPEVLAALAVLTDPRTPESYRAAMRDMLRVMNAAFAVQDGERSAA